MIGRELAVLDALEQEVQDTADAAAPPTFLQATGLGRKASVAPLDLEMRVGEVVGMAGLLGSGRTETARLLFGADRADSGEVTIDGEPVRLRNPRVALANGIAYASENRRTEGLVGNLSVRANIILAMQSARGWARAIPRRQQAELADRYVKALDIRPPDPEAIVATLSGGNQQKVLLARWLLTAPKLLLLDEPTRGIDVGAKAEIQRLVAALADDGISVLFISAELDEVLRMSHRIVVMRELHKVAEIDNRGVTEGDLMRLIAEGARDGRRGRSGVVKSIVCHPAVLAAVHPRRPARRHAAEVADLLRHPRGQRQPVRQPDHDRAAHGADLARRARHDARHRDPRHRPLGGSRRGDRRRRRGDVHRLVGASRCDGHRADRRRHRPAAVGRRRRVERVPRDRPRHPADRGHARADDRRSWRRPTDHRPAHHHAELAALPHDRRRLLARPAVLDHPRRRHPAAHRPAHAPHGTRDAPRVGRRQPGGVTPRRRAGPVDHVDGVHRVRRVRRSSPG